ncbi:MULTISPECIES: ATP-binding protein [unclassified Streptomyces]|uniref:ATP-binding protein n=1 Tax=unclassified Streptomyces TaxID=2593676 RepID=UPI00278C374F|nr:MULTISPECIES: ATP-binding protein [unclassified Streptomyces]
MGRSQVPPLYARDPVVHALVPALVGLAYEQRARRKKTFGDDLPVVLLTGRHGTGRSAVLDALDEHYRGRLPLAHVSVVPSGRAAQPGEARPDGVGPAADLVEILERLVCAFAPGLSRFPVLVPSLFAVSGWREGNAEERDAVCARHARMLLACGLMRGDERAVAREWAAKVEASLAGNAQEDPETEPGADGGEAPDAPRVTRAVLRELASLGGIGSAVRKWYAQRRPPGHPPDAGHEALVRLGGNFRYGGDFRRAGETELMAAFLDEIGSAYATVRRWNREAWPLILLDEAHTPPGRRFLELLLDHRAAPQRPGRDRITVVATHLGDLTEDEAPYAVRCELADLLPPAGTAQREHAPPVWERVGHHASAGLLVVPLTPLGRDDILNLLDPTASLLLHPHLASALHALTDGHPLSASLLCDAVVHAVGQGRAVTPKDLLHLKTEGGRPVTEVLLEQLLPERRQRDRLITFCLARNHAAAEELAKEHLHLDGPELPVNSAAQYLVERQWQPPVPLEQPLVADPLLQRLLVHEARRTLPPTEGAHSWHGIHNFLHKYHVPRADTEEAEALWHKLATGDARKVVDRLYEGFSSPAVQESVEHWMACLRSCATAPTPPAGSAPEGVEPWTDQRVRLAREEHQGRSAPRDETDRAINRLLHALWYLSEPYADADIDEDAGEMCQAVGTELGFLARRHDTWHGALGRAARDWPPAARKRLPLPIPASEGS